MDEFIPQTGGLEVRAGHEDSDISVRGIVIAGALLVVLGAAALIGCKLMITWLTQYFDAREATLSPAQQQLRNQRQAPATTAGGTPFPAGEQGTKPAPDWFGRGEMEEHLGRTFPAPRLQYDDVFDMDIFRNSENAWLDSTGKSADGAIHIPVAHAMDLLSQRGLPPVSGTFLPANAPANVLAPELSSGAAQPPAPNRGGRSR